VQRVINSGKKKFFFLFLQVGFEEGQQAEERSGDVI
jgi:hypothetical protein